MPDAAPIPEWANKSKDVTTLDWNGDGSLLATKGRTTAWRGCGEATGLCSAP